MKIEVALHNIRSLYNVGSIFRTADAAGCRTMYLCGITPSPKDEFGRWRPQITKVSLGAERYLPWQKIGSTPHLIDQLATKNYCVIAIEQNKNSLTFTKLTRSKIKNRPTLLVVGHEIRGLPPSVIDRADFLAEIPMYGQKESLNVSVAFGIVVFCIRSL